MSKIFLGIFVGFKLSNQEQNLDPAEGKGHFFQWDFIAILPYVYEMQYTVLKKKHNKLILKIWPLENSYACFL